MSGGQDKHGQQQKREQMHWIDSCQTRTQKLKVIAFGELTEFIKVIQTEDEPGKQKKKIDAHVSRLVKRPQETEPGKKGHKTVSEMKEHDENSSRGTNTGKAVEHFVERSPVRRKRAGM